jgi:hypothetical protein
VSNSTTVYWPELDWHTAYAKWLPSAIAEGHTEVNDAFRAGYLAAVKAMRDHQRGE